MVVRTNPLAFRANRALQVASDWRTRPSAWNRYACDHAAVRQRADPRRHIDVVVEQVKVPVRQQQPDIDLRIGCEKVGDDGKDVQTAEEDRRRQDQFASGRLELAGGDPLGLVDLFEDASGRSHIGGAGIGQRHLAGRADQKPGSQVGLKFASPSG